MKPSASFTKKKSKLELNHQIFY